MTEEKKAPVEGAEEVVVMAAQIADEHGVLAEGAIVAEGARALIAARFAHPEASIAIYDRLVAAEIDGAIDIDGVLVVKADEKGRLHVQKMTEHSTRTGLAWGIVGGVVAGIFLPATIVAGAVALGAAGAAAGKARNLARRLEVEQQLAGVITAGTSGIICLVSARAVDAVKAKMHEAEEVRTVAVDEETAEAVKAAAAEAAKPAEA